MSMKNDLKNRDIVLYSLYLLGGLQKRINTEDVALKCFNLAPRKFSWIKYPKIPDLAPVSFTLEKSTPFVDGESERKSKIGGWRLTSIGRNWIKNNLDRIEEILGKHKQVGNRLFDDRRLNILFKSPAYQKFLSFKNDPEITYAEFTESLICTVNTDTKILNEKLEQLEVTAEKLNKKRIIDYLKFCKTKFKSNLGFI